MGNCCTGKPDDGGRFNELEGGTSRRSSNNRGSAQSGALRASNASRGFTPLPCRGTPQPGRTANLDENSLMGDDEVDLWSAASPHRNMELMSPTSRCSSVAPSFMSTASTINPSNYRPTIPSLPQQPMPGYGWLETEASHRQAILEVQDHAHKLMMAAHNKIQHYAIASDSTRRRQQLAMAALPARYGRGGKRQQEKLIVHSADLGEQQQQYGSVRRDQGSTEEFRRMRGSDAAVEDQESWIASSTADGGESFTPVESGVTSGSRGLKPQHRDPLGFHGRSATPQAGPMRPHWKDDALLRDFALQPMLKGPSRIVNNWQFLTLNGAAEYISEGGVFFKFVCRPYHKLENQDLDVIANTTQFTSFEDETLENGVPKIDAFDKEQMGAFTTIMVKSMYSLPGIYDETMLTPELISSFGFQRAVQPSNIKVWEDTPPLTFRITKPIIPLIFSLVIQMKCSLLTDPAVLQDLATHDGTAPFRAIFMERTKRNPHVQDHTACCKSLLLYYRVKGGIVVSNQSVILNRTLPNVISSLVHNFGGRGAAEAADTAHLTRKFFEPHRQNSPQDDEE